MTFVAIQLLSWAAGCQLSDSPPPPIITPTTNPTRLATTQRSYWTTQPAAVTVQSTSFNKLWIAAEDTAREFGFRLDRQDPRLGVLSTDPVTSKQLWEVWRKDSGNLTGTIDNSLESYRRSVRFQFEKIQNGYAVIPRVIIERYTQAEQHIMSSVYLRYAFGGGGNRYRPQGTKESDRGVYLPQAYWYATGRDYDLENQIAESILRKLR
jgi:hypothetical protein